MVFCLLTMVIVVLAGVFFRYIQEMPLAWADEMALLCQVWMAFIGASVAYQCYGHMGIDMCMAMVADKQRTIVEGFTEIMLLVLFIYLTAAGVEVSWSVKESVTPGLNVSVALQYLPAVFGGALMTFWSIDRLISKIVCFFKKER